MSVKITIRHAAKRYGANTVIPDLSLTIHNGEFFTLLGPSGCGKTTLLRMIAGFNSIEGGDFFFNETRINDLDPVRRNIGMVFQNYAIFPNMSVRKNVAFGLKNRKFPESEIKERTDRYLKLVHVDSFADRMPDRLSGGQQQRVALARALCINPDVLLMDEPLSNLDAKLRVEMRTVIKRIQHDVGITTVYVTHDQEEAMAISDRIAVMKEGEIHQCGKPKDIYMRPADLFVATFIGKSNILKGTLSMHEGHAFVSLGNGYGMEVPSVDSALCKDGMEVMVSLRPEELKIGEHGMKALIEDSVFLGLNTHYFTKLETGERIELVQESDMDEILPPGSSVYLEANTRKINLFDAESGKSIMQGVHSDLGM